jgi:Zn-dependent protease with chaperone function
VALIGHELGHSVNGDFTRMFFVGSAINALEGWYNLVRPTSLLSSESGIPGFVMLPVNIVLFALARCAWFGVYLLAHLLYRDGQRAEYLADYHASVVAGSVAGVSSNKLIYFYDLFEFTVQKVAANPSGRRLFEELEYQRGMLPERELERIGRVSMMEQSRLNMSHPPTIYRMEFLRKRYAGEPKVVMTPSEAERLNQELATLHARVEHRILEDYRASLYG